MRQDGSQHGDDSQRYQRVAKVVVAVAALHPHGGALSQSLEEVFHEMPNVSVMRRIAPRKVSLLPCGARYLLYCSLFMGGMRAGGRYLTVSRPLRSGRRAISRAGRVALGIPEPSRFIVGTSSLDPRYPSPPAAAGRIAAGRALGKRGRLRTGRSRTSRTR